MIPSEYHPILKSLVRHNACLGLDKRLKGIVYERCLELPLLVSRMRNRFPHPLRMLDIGSGDSLFPSYLASRTDWHVTVVDKHEWVHRQKDFFVRSLQGKESAARFEVVEQDFLGWVPTETEFDLITCISVIEHFEGGADTVAIKKAASLLRKGGLLFLTTPVNEGHFHEFYVRSDVYGKDFTGEPVFFQRHYDTASLEDRLVRPSGLIERERVFFGDYGFRAKELFMNVPWPWKPIKGCYQWATPIMARRWGSYSSRPVSRPDMAMYTASGVFLLLEKS
jgi:SAM-dependent methyltransferase